MTDPRTQIRQYASQLAEGQRPIEAAEAMSRRGAVRELPEPRRIQEHGRRLAPRWAYAVASLVVAVSVGAALVWLMGSSGDQEPAGPSTTTPVSTIPSTVATTEANPSTVATTEATATTTTIATTTTQAALPAPAVLGTTHYGGRGFDYAVGVAAAPGGGSVAAIDFRSSNEGDLVVAKFSPDGELTWSTAWSTTREDAPMRGAIATDASGAAYVGVAMFDLERVNHELALLKFDAGGELLWQRASIGVDGGQRPHVVAVGSDGSVFVAGHHDLGIPGDPEHVFMMNVAPDGQLLWQRLLVGEGMVSGTAFAGTVDPSGNVVLAGAVGDYADEVDALIVKLDPAGDILWQRSWGVPGAPDRAWNVVTDPDGDIYVSGPVFGVGDGGDQTFVVKIDSEGALLWARIWQIPGNELWAHGAAFGDGILVVSGFVGRVDADGLRMDKSSSLLGVSPDGELLWQAAIGARPLESIESLAFTDDGTLVAAGQAERAELNVVALDGEWLVSDLPLAATSLTAVDLDLPWGEGDGEITAPEGAVGGGSGADAVVMRLELP